VLVLIAEIILYKINGLSFMLVAFTVKKTPKYDNFLSCWCAYNIDQTFRKERLDLKAHMAFWLEQTLKDMDMITKCSSLSVLDKQLG